jgi:hypothetical protein
MTVCRRGGPERPRNNKTIVKSMRPMWAPAFPAKAGMKRRALLLIGGWSALALYLVAYAPAGLGLAALAGSFDCNHQVQVRCGERGLALALHHGSNCARHQHGAMARALTCFAQPASATDPDHVIRFGTTDTLSAKAQLAPPPLQRAEQPAPALAEAFLVPSSHEAEGFARPGSPPGECGRARCLRPAVLLI